MSILKLLQMAYNAKYAKLSLLDFKLCAYSYQYACGPILTFFAKMILTKFFSKQLENDVVDEIYSSVKLIKLRLSQVKDNHLFSAYEEKKIIFQMGCGYMEESLRVPLSEGMEELFVKEASYCALKNYLSKFDLSSPAEIVLIEKLEEANRVSDMQKYINYKDMVLLYIKNSHNPFKNERSQNRLFVSLFEGNLDIRKALIAKKCDMSDPYLSKSIFEYLIARKQTSLLKLFLSLSYFPDDSLYTMLSSYNENKHHLIALAKISRQKCLLKMVFVSIDGKHYSDEAELLELLDAENVQLPRKYNEGLLASELDKLNYSIYCASKIAYKMPQMVDDVYFSLTKMLEKGIKPYFVYVYK